MAQTRAISAELNAGRHFRKNMTVRMDVRVRGLRMLRLRGWLAAKIMLAAVAVLGCQADVTVIYDNERS